MHAFLIVGNNEETLKIKTEELAKKYSAKILEYPLVKIEDVRNLNNFLRLTVTEPTIILTKNIEETGIEALNAFLKNLEEPQENLYFVLTTQSIQKVLPTIVSRCQIIKSTNKQINKSTNEKASEFLEMTSGKRFAFIDKIKDRAEALAFVVNLIDTHHCLLREEGNDLVKIANNLDIEIKTFNNLKSNGNVGLQLTNMVVNLI
jgi:hypothetical protein